jgi:hypothetical protein
VKAYAATAINVKRERVIVISPYAILSNLMPHPLHAFGGLRTKVYKIAETSYRVGLLSVRHCKQRFVVAVNI